MIKFVPLRPYQFFREYWLISLCVILACLSVGDRLTDIELTIGALLVQVINLHNAICTVREQPWTFSTMALLLTNTVIGCCMGYIAYSPSTAGLIISALIPFVTLVVRCSIITTIVCRRLDRILIDLPHSS